MFMVNYYPYKLIISYNGTDYSGWQRQKAEYRTVQGEIEAGLRKILKNDNFSFFGSSRTDTGVHANGQVALLKLDEVVSEKKFKDRLNFNLPMSIRIMSFELVSADFNPQMSLESKEYHYYFSTQIISAANEAFVLKVDAEVDIGLMQQACKLLVGTHSFEAFTTDKIASKNTMREIYHSELAKTQMAFQEGELYFIKIEGNGFLKYMVRNIVAAILMVGEGLITLDQFSLLIKNEFHIDFKKAPAKGLHLFRINYSGK